jgi:hypothetical protein
MKPRHVILTPIMLLGLVLAATPALAGVSIIGGLTHERVVTRGEVYQGIVLLKNTDDNPEEAKIYLTDYHFSADGRIDYGPPGTRPRSNAAWIEVSPARCTIPPQEVVPVRYRCSIPQDPGLTGTYWSMLMVEGVPTGSPEGSGPTRDRMSFGIQQVVRYGIQMVTHIGATGTSTLTFTHTRLLKAAEGRVLQVDLENTGTRWLRPTLWSELYDEQGVYVGRFDAGGQRLYPGTSARFKVDLSQVPAGTYKALVVADCGGDAVFGATYTLKLGK